MPAMCVTGAHRGHGPLLHEPTEFRVDDIGSAGLRACSAAQARRPALLKAITARHDESHQNAKRAPTEAV